ncbi:MAG: methyl-accepting chemotaxis protein [Sulfurimonas sp.]|uniref:methyl-accepting chemotaxis protein n=1 Tax=Sulfurimonas sp. TaxID=2022749 RepID=UPI00262E2B58|nr:methyl-accepting chemotaxis protein [Sulfurimonas sp.]MDD5373111.1 methyl-accepting chemotaxis protein [Sulfurimonas sp.]
MGWLENMLLRSKLMLLTAVLMIALAVIGFLGYKAVNAWEADVKELGEVRANSLVSVGTIRYGVLLFAIQVNRSTGLKGDPEIKTKMQNVSELMQKAFERIDEGLNSYKKVMPVGEEAVAWQKFVADYEQWRKRNEVYKSDVIEGLSKSSDPEQAEILFGKIGEHLKNITALRVSMEDNLQKLYTINKDNMAKTTKRAEEQSTSYRELSMMVIIISVMLSIGLAAIVIRSITRSITMSVTSIRDGATQITSASSQVASSSSSLAQGASEQAASVEEVSATLEQSTAINTQNTDNARQADILAKNANDSARAGYEKGEHLSHSMQAITESATRISGIIKAIDQIAFQTNLLALNAAVEAARAGEHGLGFAVVADEVRNLAQRAALAAKETAVIIEEVLGQIKEGNQIAHATHTSFKEIVEQSKKVSDLIGEISIAGKEQSEGMVQINQAMGQVDQVTQQVAANSEEAAAAAEELNAQATSMMEAVYILAKMVGMDTDVAVVKTKRDFVHQPDIKTPQMMHKTAKVAPKRVIPNKAEEIFPLHEDDLKEF